MTKSHFFYPSSGFFFRTYETTMAQFQSPARAAECSKYIEERNNTTVVLCVASKSGKTDISTGIKSD